MPGVGRSPAREDCYGWAAVTGQHGADGAACTVAQDDSRQFWPARRWWLLS